MLLKPVAYLANVRTALVITMEHVFATLVLMVLFAIVVPKVIREKIVTRVRKELTSFRAVFVSHAIAQIAADVMHLGYANVTLGSLEDRAIRALQDTKALHAMCVRQDT